MITEIIQKEITPAAIISALCQIGLEPKLRGSSFSLLSSPVSFTNAPAGMRLIEYSVSPNCLPHNRGGMNMPNSSTRTPNFLASKKCPISWSVISPIKLKKTIKIVESINQMSEFPISNFQ